MKMIRYISAAAMPIVILIIIGYGILEKNKVYDTLLIGVKEGAKIVIKLFLPLKLYLPYPLFLFAYLKVPVEYLHSFHCTLLYLHLKLIYVII